MGLTHVAPEMIESSLKIEPPTALLEDPREVFVCGRLTDPKAARKDYESPSWVY